MITVVEDGVRGLVPDVAVEYLRRIVEGDDAILAIRLVPVKLSADYVQEIVCERPDGTIRRRVFGFPPVRATLCVSRDGGGAVLKLTA